MRFHYTAAFCDAHTRYDAARKEYAAFDETDAVAESRAESHLGAADTLFFNVDAYTPTEVLAKVEAAHDRARDDFPLTDFYRIDAVRQDMERMRRYSVSPAFADQWEAWAKLDEAWACGEEVLSGMPVEDLRNQGYCALQTTGCVTPGDFILKRYMALLTSYGGCDNAAEREAMTANRWDIDTSTFAEEARFDHADLLGAYDDIDSTDLGANLLAYGKLDFDAEAWMEAAERVGQEVNLAQQRDGTWMFGTSLLYADEGSTRPRIRRERDRLLRLKAWQGGADRHRLLAEEIRANWPQLLVWNPAAEVGKAISEALEQA